MRRCVFCDTPLRAGKDGNKADEHLIPKWLQKRLGVKETPMVASVANFVTGDSVERTHTMMTVIAKDVCKGCNGGWMNDLELNVAPILEKFLRGEAGIWMCPEEEQLLLRKWAYKTTLAAVEASPLKDKHPSVEHYRNMWSSQDVPANVHVIAGHVGGNMREISFVLLGRLSVLYSPDGAVPPVEGIGNSYIFVIQIGNTIFAVLYCEASEHVMALQANHYWPVGRPLSDYAWYKAVQPQMMLYKEQTAMLLDVARSMVIMSKWPSGVDVLKMRESPIEYVFIDAPQMMDTNMRPFPMGAKHPLLSDEGPLAIQF